MDQLLLKVIVSNTQSIIISLYRTVDISNLPRGKEAHPSYWKRYISPCSPCEITGEKASWLIGGWICKCVSPFKLLILKDSDWVTLLLLLTSTVSVIISSISNLITILAKSGNLSSTLLSHLVLFLRLLRNLSLVWFTERVSGLSSILFVKDLFSLA